jgi:hypothetical protein
MKNEDKLHVGWSKKYEENMKKIKEKEQEKKK